MKKFLSWVLTIAFFIGFVYYNYQKEIAAYEDGGSGSEDAFGDIVVTETWPYRDHLFVNGKKSGDSKELKGKLLISVIFVDENGNHWNSSEMETTKGEVYESTERLKREAASYGVLLEVEHSFLQSATGETVNKQNQEEWSDEALRGAGFSDEEKAIRKMRSEYSATEAAILFAVKSDGRSFAHTVRGGGEGLEYAILYSDLGGDYLHELLHLFGARDFYYPDEINELAKSCFPDSVMRNNNKEKTVDPLTAYLVGWTDSPSAEAERFLEESAHLTSEDLAEAYKEETKTGFGTVTRENGSYAGYLDNGLFHGSGTYVWNDGARLTGTFSNGEPVSGTLTMPDGDKYVGGFKNWKRHGNGTYTWIEGVSLTGTFSNGEPVSGTKVWADGTRYEGYFKDWKMHGQGTLTYANGKVRSGQWSNGNFVG